MVFSCLSGIIKPPPTSSRGLMSAIPLGPRNQPPIICNQGWDPHMVKLVKKETQERNQTKANIQKGRWRLIGRKKKLKELKKNHKNFLPASRCTSIYKPHFVFHRVDSSSFKNWKFSVLFEVVPPLPPTWCKCPRFDRVPLIIASCSLQATHLSHSDWGTSVVWVSKQFRSEWHTRKQSNAKRPDKSGPLETSAAGYFFSQNWLHYSSYCPYTCTTTPFSPSGRQPMSTGATRLKSESWLQQQGQ